MLADRSKNSLLPRPEYNSEAFFDPSARVVGGSEPSICDVRKEKSRLSVHFSGLSVAIARMVSRVTSRTMGSSASKPYLSPRARTVA